jgi:hypothetical protein
MSILIVKNFNDYAIINAITGHIISRHLTLSRSIQEAIQYK